MKPLFFLPIFLPTLHAAEFQRELSADRPDTTESPITVEAGKFQIETSLWSFTKDGSDESWTVGEMNLKAGVSQSSDLQLILRPWIHENTGDQTSEGFGDIELRLKHNLWGNDEGKTAGALMPYISAPTKTAVSSGKWEGGLIFPVSIELTKRLGVGVQLEAARVWEDDSGEYEWDFLHSAVLGISLTEKIGLFVEYVGIASEGDYEATGNVGATWSCHENLQWDVAVGVGLNDAANDFSVAQGVTFRF
jgi:hypothetical protein